MSDELDLYAIETKTELNNFLSTYTKNVKKIIFEPTFKYFSMSLSTVAPTVGDIKESVFWNEIEKYKKIKDKGKRKQSIVLMRDFMCHLVLKYDSFDFFQNAVRWNKKMLFQCNFTYLLGQGYYFVKYSQENKIIDTPRVAFYFDSIEKFSTRLEEGRTLLIDLTQISSVEYRKFFYEYLYSMVNPVVFLNSGLLKYTIDCLAFIEKIKTEKGYPNPDLFYMTNQEALLLKKRIEAKDRSIGTMNNEIGADRRLLNFLQDTDRMQFDDIFFEYLRQFEEPQKNTAKSIPDDDLIKLNDALLELVKTGQCEFITYCIFHLAIQTEFRLNQIRHLKIDCLKPTFKKTQYAIESYSKTSHGSPKTSVVSDITYKLIQQAIEETEELRDECIFNQTSQYIFLHRFSSSKIDLITERMLGGQIDLACQKAGIPHYCFANLRDTHMTKAYEYILRNKKSDIEMSVLSKHRFLDTTKNHYIETQLNKMLEATYGIIIGQELIDPESKIVDKIPEQYNDKEFDVQYGCGKCTSENCTMLGALPCLACKHFITTVQHKTFFTSAIDSIDKMIKDAPTRHDIDDLNTIKGLYVLYLRAISAHEEGEC